PGGILGGMRQPLEQVSQAALCFLRSCADALLERKNAPALDAVERALAKFIATIEELRREGATRALPVENIGRLYTLGFAVEQLRQNFVDFRNRVTECARSDSEALNGHEPFGCAIERSPSIEEAAHEQKDFGDGSDFAQASLVSMDRLGRTNKCPERTLRNRRNHLLCVLICRAVGRSPGSRSALSARHHGRSRLNRSVSSMVGACPTWG